MMSDGKVLHNQGKVINPKPWENDDREQLSLLIGSAGYDDYMADIKQHRNDREDDKWHEQQVELVLDRQDEIEDLNKDVVDKSNQVNKRKYQKIIALDDLTKAVIKHRLYEGHDMGKRKRKNQLGNAKNYKSSESFDLQPKPKYEMSPHIQKLMDQCGDPEDFVKKVTDLEDSQSPVLSFGRFSKYIE